MRQRHDRKCLWRGIWTHMRETVVRSGLFALKKRRILLWLRAHKQFRRFAPRLKQADIRLWPDARQDAGADP